MVAGGSAAADEWIAAQSLLIPIAQHAFGRFRWPFASLKTKKHILLSFDYRYLRRLHAINISEGRIGRELWKSFVFLEWALAVR
jgi:hypothetical protein